MSAIRDFFTRLFGRAGEAPSKKPQKAAASGLNPADLSAEWLIVGLGNPGAKYAATRHNVGYMAVDDLLAESGDMLEPVTGHQLSAAQLELGGTKVVALRSHTYMNLSGDPIAPLATLLGVAAQNIIVIHDELDLPAGKVRIKKGGNENGHNGLKSLSERLGTRDYLRVRIGIGRPPKGGSIPDWVLAPVDASAELDSTIATAAEAARLIVAEGLNKAQQEIHSRAK